MQRLIQIGHCLRPTAQLQVNSSANGQVLSQLDLSEPGWSGAPAQAERAVRVVQSFAEPVQSKRVERRIAVRWGKALILRIDHLSKAPDAQCKSLGRVALGCQTRAELQLCLPERGLQAQRSSKQLGSRLSMSGIKHEASEAEKQARVVSDAPPVGCGSE